MTWQYLQNWFTGVVAFFAFVYLFFGRWEHMMSQAKGDAQVDGVDSDPSTHPRGPQQMNQTPPREESGVHKGSLNGESPV